MHNVETKTHPTKLARILDHSIDEAVKAVQLLQNPELKAQILEIARHLASAFSSNQKVLIAGNGGSLCDAAHFAEELTGIFRKKRKALPALVLSEGSHITCIANDIGYEFVFSRSIEAFGQPNDVFIALSTSGNSKNLYLALEKAKELNLTTIALLGKNGGSMKGLADFEILIKGFSWSDRIQEVHMTILHMICELVEAELFGEEEPKFFSPYV